MKRGQLDERDLVAAFCTSSDTNAFAAIYERHVQQVYGLLTRILGPVDEREDVLQEVFVELARALPKFRGDSRLSTFVYRIAVRVGARHARRFRRLLPIDASEVERCVSTERSPWQQTLDREELALVFEALMKVKYSRRVAFVLSAVEGLSHAEVGSVLGISPAAAKQLSLRGRRDVAAKLKQRTPACQRKDNS